MLENIVEIAEDGIEIACTTSEEILLANGFTENNEDFNQESKNLLFVLIFLVKGKLREVEAKNILRSLGVGEKVALAILEAYSRVSAKYAIVLRNNQTLSKVHFKKLRVCSRLLPYFRF